MNELYEHTDEWMGVPGWYWGVGTVLVIYIAWRVLVEIEKVDRDRRGR